MGISTNSYRNYENILVMWKPLKRLSLIPFEYQENWPWKTVHVLKEHVMAGLESTLYFLDWRLHDSHIYQEFKSTDMKYKTRLRSRISNLKDQKNPDLRRNVLCGNILPDRIANMTAEVRVGVLYSCLGLRWFIQYTVCYLAYVAGDGECRAERDQESSDQGVHSRAPALQSGRHRDGYVRLWQVQGKELHLHSGMMLRHLARNYDCCITRYVYNTKCWHFGSPETQIPTKVLKTNLHKSSTCSCDYLVCLEREREFVSRFILHWRIKCPGM